MIEPLPPPEEMYEALLKKDSRYEGLFFLGVKTTGIFCRPTCPARKPRFENVEFFATTHQALDAGYRPCKKCHPMQPAGAAPDWVRQILDEVDADPSRRWRDRDLRRFQIDPNRLRRWFRKNHKMTFQCYLRLRRLGMALGRIQHGENLTQTAFDHGYESLSGFRQAMKNLIGKAPIRGKESLIVYLNRISTPLGPMLVGASEKYLCLLEFTDRRMLETQLKRLTRKMNCAFVPGSNSITEEVNLQIREYFAGRLKKFSAPIATPGTSFQQAVWRQLTKIPYGQTRSYGEQAKAIAQPRAVRAVARANGDNRIAIIIPCHRVIGANGNLCGYGGGLWRKKYLLNLERKFSLADGKPEPQNEPEVRQ